MRDLIHTFRSVRGRGITLIEMMVALAITTFVILVVNQLFNSVVDTVARGTQASELLQKSREMDQQLVFETELAVNSPASVPGNWLSRMVGPRGRNGSTDPGGFLAIVQRVVQAPLTIEDGIRGNTRLIRSDQLMFVYDQKSGLDAGAKRLPAMAPSSVFSFTGDDRDSYNAEYVRMWYGHVLQIPKGADPLADYNMASPASYRNIELGNTAGSNNPNILAQDWVLGRHALFLTDSSLNINPGTPYGQYVSSLLPIMTVQGGIPSSRLANGVTDVANLTLNNLVGPTGIFGIAPSPTVYQGSALVTMFTQAPLLTAAKSEGNSGDMRAWDVSPSHTYFMGGVSDFIVEFAGDLVQGHFTRAITTADMSPDGELDRDGQGRIKWYTALGANPRWNPAVFDEDRPITTPAPDPGTGTGQYTPHVLPATVNSFFTNRFGYTAGNQAAFVWQHHGSPGFTQWPWMIRIRYRLHDRRGDFEGRQVTNNATNQKEPEPGVWFETIIPVNYQNAR